MNRKLVRVLTADYEIERCTLLYRGKITRAEIERIVRQRHLILPVSKGKNVGQALFSKGAARGGLGGGRGVAVEVVADPTVAMLGRETRGQRMVMLARVAKVAAAPHPQADHIPQSDYDKVKGKCICCLEPGHMWYQRKARVTPASERTSGEGVQGQNYSGETVCCLANAMFSRSDDSCAEEVVKA